MTAALAQEARERLNLGNAPEDYQTLFSAYHGMLISMAAKMGIPQADIEDAAAEVEYRFWRDDWLSKYDSTLLHMPPKDGWRDGHQGPRTARFATFYRRYVGLSLLAERDRHQNRIRRFHPTAPEDLSASTGDGVSDYCEREQRDKWVRDAARALCEKGYTVWAYALPELTEHALMTGRQPTRAELETILGIPVTSAKTMLRKLSETLSLVGFGPETLARQ